jgi:glycosyltransferase involved in cell wall biosynthesis
MNKSLEYLRSRAREGLSLPLTVLKPSVYTSLGVDRGVILCSPGMIVFLLMNLPQEVLKSRWLVVDSVQGYGFGENSVADLHLIASPSLIDDYLASPHGGIPYSVLGDGGDFVNPLLFYPMPVEPVYDVVLIASWAPLKRHKLLLEAARVLKNNNSPIRILMMGSYCVPGHVSTMDEALEYEDSVRCLATTYQLDVNILQNRDVSHENHDGSSVLGEYTKVEVNKLINQARIGVLPSLEEGTNRFAAECLCANRPVIVLETLKGGTTKYISEKTGLKSGDSPEDLARTIRNALDNLTQFEPRRAFLLTYGFYNSNRELERAIAAVASAQADNVFTMPSCRFGGDMWSLDYYNVYLPIMNEVMSQVSHAV